MNNLIITNQQSNQERLPYIVEVETKFKILAIYTPNTIQDAVMKNDVIPKVKEAADIFAEKLRQYAFDLIRTNRL